MNRVMRKKILMGVAVALFALLGLTANSSAVSLSLPDPTQPLSAPISGQSYYAWAHDDFWSYSTKLMVADPTAVDPLIYGDWNVVTGQGQLGVVIASPGHVSNITYALPNSYQDRGVVAPYNVVWGFGLTGPGPGSSILPGAYARVGDVYDYIQGGNPNDTTPVFGLTMAGSDPFAFVGHVYIWDKSESRIATLNDGTILDFAFDNDAQPYTGPTPPRLAYPGDPDGDWPGFRDIGSYQTEAYAVAIPYPGSGHLDYVAVAPKMDLAKLLAAGMNPDDYFVVDFIAGGHLGDVPGPDGTTITLGDPGNLTVYLLNAVGAPVGVPEPATLLLLGLGLVGLAGVGMRRKFKR